MPILILEGGRMEIQSDSPFPCGGGHLGNVLQARTLTIVFISSTLILISLSNTS